MGDEFLTLDDVAKLFGIARATLRNRCYMKYNVPPFVNPSKGVYLFPKKEFERWIKDNTVKAS